MLILGIDPGPKLHGYALIHATRARRVHVASGKCDSSEMLARIRTPVGHPEGAQLVAVERAVRILGGFDSPQRARAIAEQMFAAQFHAGTFFNQAAGRAITIEAAKWREGIIGMSSPSDAQVRAVILRLVEGWPKTSSAGEHACDAAGIALAASNFGACRTEREWR